MTPVAWLTRLRRKESAVLGGLLLLTLVSGWLCAVLVDFKPQVSPYFFFSSDDPQLRTELEITQQFEQASQIIISARGPVDTPAYVERVGKLTKSLKALPEVFSVLSLTSGPRSPSDAFESPLWRRILIAKDSRATYLIAFVPELPSDELVHNLEATLAYFEQDGFHLVMSGIPYVIELMRRYLVRDLRVFSLATLIMFGTLILLLVRSVRLVAGMLTTCLSAGAITLLATHVCGIRVGLLTANLVTIVFTMALSHMVFMTFNWQHLRSRTQADAAALALQAARRTLVPSFWSMFTTLLGFISLLFVQAEPLRRLGVAGAVGTPVALVVVYLAFPWTLWICGDLKRHRHRAWQWEQRLEAWLAGRHQRAAIVIGLGCLLISTGIGRLHKDPNLLSYFHKPSPLLDGLEDVDRNLGSSPLSIVVRDPRGARFSSTEMYQRLWDLHQALEQQRAVGSVVSLPVIMAEARRVPLLGGILPWEWLLEIMELPVAKRIGKYFVTEDRRQGRFLLLMQESAREGSRLQTVASLRRTVEAHGFDPYLVGGIYILQGKLSQLVVSSLISGLLILFGLFAAIAFWLSRSWRVSAAVMGSLALIPLWMLGLIGHLRVPFDVISAPAANLAISMGVDSLIHLLMAARRSAAGKPLVWTDWVEAKGQQWRAIVYSTIVVCAGFGIFGLSAFPPSQRFGLSIVIGTILVPGAALLVLPALAVGRAPVGHAR